MGPVLIANMSPRGVAEPPSQKMHPFFAKAHPTDLAEAPPGQPFVLDNARNSTQEPHHRASTAKRRKSNHPPSRRIDNAEASNSVQAGDVSAASCMQADPDRYVTRQAVQCPTPISTQPQEIPATPEFPTVLHSLCSGESERGLASVVTEGSTSTDATSRRKVLKFNTKTGTLGSPPRMKQKAKTSRIVCVRYGKDEVDRKVMGAKITQILDGDLRLPTIPLKPQRICEQAEDDNSSPSLVTSKTTHPFFTSKTKPPRSSTPSQSTNSATRSPSKKHSVFMSTPMSPRKPKDLFAPMIQKKAPPRSGTWSGGTRVPGAQHPLWPPKGMSHVWGGDCAPLPTACQRPKSVGIKKSKGQVTTVGQTESVLTTMMEHIDVQALRGSLSQDDDAFTPAPPELRIPQRHFESGLKLQHRIRPQLSISSPVALAGEVDVNQDELAGPAPAAAHAGITRHYVSLARQLSAFDRSTCENLAWNQKYAPVCAAQVLQKGKDAIYIKDWLEAMKVQSVETGSSDGASDKNKSKADMVAKKRRKKNKVDDFIIDTEDEASELEEIYQDGGEEDHDDDFSWHSKKSVIRSASTRSKEARRLKNTIVVSGPHGCGKTAAVYAVAKELDFEVFEINSSSRRSGKDVLERIGDMTRNHLVQPHRAHTPTVADGETTEATAGSVSRPSNRQYTMAAFFKAKPGPKEKTKQAKTAARPKAAKRPKAQKQSLILVEEADVLYEEDKQLWATLVGMMNQSKRPFVITCNDESLVPLQSLDLHGIFRFGPAPTAPAVDLCILMAANEGHALRRGAAEALFRSRGCDLRATICDLNFWCQIGVGDRRGGFDWFYSRWPKGCDVDERGDVVRVVSQDTYRHGMGWIGRDAVLSERSGLGRQTEVLRQSWDFWQVDMGDWCSSAEMRALARDLGRMVMKSSSRGKQQAAAALEALDDFYRTQSDADVLSGGIFAEPLRERLDASVPDIATRTRDDVIIGRGLLDAHEVSHHTRDSQSISVALKCQARTRLYSASQRILLRPLDKAATKQQQQQQQQQHAVLSEPAAIAKLDASFGKQVEDRMTRMDIARAFDPIAVAPRAQATSYLEPSVFDRPMGLIVLDVAPWVRGIVASEHRLMRERRERLGSVLGEGGTTTRKRMRNTRSAYSALEGVERRSARRERYFGDVLTTGLVMRTGGGAAWEDAVEEWMRRRGGAVEEEQRVQGEKR